MPTVFSTEFSKEFHRRSTPSTVLAHTVFGTDQASGYLYAEVRKGDPVKPASSYRVTEVNSKVPIGGIITNVTSPVPTELSE